MGAQIKLACTTGAKSVAASAAAQKKFQAALARLGVSIKSRNATPSARSRAGGEKTQRRLSLQGGIMSNEDIIARSVDSGTFSTPG
jgi:hypothetical protein